MASRDVMEASPPVGDVSFHYDPTTELIHTLQGHQADADLSYIDAQRWRLGESTPLPTRSMLELYLPFLGSHTTPAMVVGHLGQSIDAKIATTEGDAFFVTGEENRTHLHRMRALCHAVLVGAETVVADNPQLTTRAVDGPNPIRIVIDPTARVSADNILWADALAPTWLIHNETVDLSRFSHDPINVTRIAIGGSQRRLAFPDVLRELRSRGVHRVFVEGGGVTVSGMLSANCLDRMQVAVAPLMVGAGRQALQLPGASSMKNALRPPFKLYRMGEDVLWDFDLRAKVPEIVEEVEGTSTERKDAVLPSIERLL